MYLHGPEDLSRSVSEEVADALFDEQVALDSGFAEKVAEAQAIHARYTVVQYLAISPQLWGYVKLAMGYAGTPVERRRMIRQWLKEAKEMRARMIEASLKDALARATR